MRPHGPAFKTLDVVFLVVVLIILVGVADLRAIMRVPRHTLAVKIVHLLRGGD